MSPWLVLASDASDNRLHSTPVGSVEPVDSLEDDHSFGTSLPRNDHPLSNPSQALQLHTLSLQSSMLEVDDQASSTPTDTINSSLAAPQQRTPSSQSSGHEVDVQDGSTPTDNIDSPLAAPNTCDTNAGLSDLNSETCMPAKPAKHCRVTTSSSLGTHGKRVKPTSKPSTSVAHNTPCSVNTNVVRPVRLEDAISANYFQVVQVVDLTMEESVSWFLPCHIT
ncbi:hypothetical protein C0992_012278 [Termitomyces sp. T32_za158]|nr:hypothetical protein C0992_012278 [Termitomyces sp. T32_za158]